MFFFGMPPARGKKGSEQSIDIKPVKRYILYFDILGYKAYFDNKENDVLEFLSNTIALLDDIGEEAEHARDISRNLRYKTFSDNFIFIVEEENQDYAVLSYLVQLCAHLQLSFLTKYKITVRGAICFGLIYLDERIVFGEGLVKAVGMEGAAIYPRVVVDDEIINNFCPAVLENELVSKDNDNKYYVDYFQGVEVDNIYNPDPKKKRSICRLRDNVCTLIEKHGHFDGRISDPDRAEIASKVINKYVWLLVKYNEAIIREKLPVKINYEIAINTKLFRFEIVNVSKNPWPIAAN